MATSREEAIRRAMETSRRFMPMMAATMSPGKVEPILGALKDLYGKQIPPEISQRLWGPQGDSWISAMMQGMGRMGPGPFLKEGREVLGSQGSDELADETIRRLFTVLFGK